MNRDVCSADIRSIEPRKITPSQMNTGSQFFRRRLKFISVAAGACKLSRFSPNGCRYSCGNRIMSKLNLTTPLTFEPIFMERMWGGRRLESEFGKKLPAQKRIGESWEIVDRPEAQSVVANGPLRGKTLHELWTQDRGEIFGNLPDASRFPLLVKLLDAHEKLS